MAKKCLAFEFNTPLLHLATTKLILTDTDFQEITIVLSKCSATGVESTF